jgi:MFS family permease
MPRAHFFALCVAAFAAAFGYTAVMPFLPQLLSPLMPQASALELAWHVGTYAATYMVAGVIFAPVWGAASDRYGAKTAIAAGLAGSAVAVFASSFADGLWSAYAGRAVQGAFASAILPVASAALARIADTAERARKVAGLGAASLIGFFAAPALSAAVVAVRAGGAVAVALYASGIAALGALIFVGLLVPRTSLRRLEAPPEGERKLPRRFLALNLVAYLGLGAFEVALPLAARGPLALDSAQVSLLFAECSVVMLAAQGALMWSARYRGRFEQVLVAAMAAYGAGVLWLAGVGSMGAAVAAVGVIAAASGLVLPLTGYLATLEIDARPGAALGALTAAGSLGQAIGSASGGAFYGYAGSGMFTATAFVVGLGAWLASRACAPRWLGGESRCGGNQETM